MEKSTDKLTNEQLDKLVLESTHPMNSLEIKIPYAYFSELVKLNWYDVLFAIENAYLPLKAAVDHAIKEVEENPDYYDTVFNLAMISPNDISSNEEISKNIVSLAELVSDSDKSITKEKILFVLLSWIYENQKNYDDPLRVIEIIYDDFNFPEIIKKFVRYEPSSNTIHGTIDENNNRLYSNWQDYLKVQIVKYHQS